MLRWVRLSVAELARLHVGLGCAKPKAVRGCAPVPLPLTVPTARARGATQVLFRDRVLGTGFNVASQGRMVASGHISDYRKFLSARCCNVSARIPAALGIVMKASC